MHLENDPKNPCVGCGPLNPRGLQLKFEKVGEEVRSTLPVRPEWQGWPGLLHSGVLYIAMLETANWTVYGLKDRVGLPVGTSALELKRRTRVGDIVQLTGRHVASRTGPFIIEVTASDSGGSGLARLEREYEFPRRAEFVRRMGYGTLPAELEEVVPP